VSEFICYSTTIDARKTVHEITEIIAAHGAKGVLTQYDEGRITGLAFQVMGLDGDLLSINLPARVSQVNEVLQRLLRQGKISRRWTRAEDGAQAERVAWRVLKVWVQAQMALIEVGMVRMEEVFLPYVLVGDQNRTVFEVVSRQRFLQAGRVD
jgi:hypothetical protein